MAVGSRPQRPNRLLPYMFDDHDDHPLMPPHLEGVRAWENGGVANSGSWSQLLQQTGETLQTLERKINHEGNRAFLIRLAKDIKEDDIRLPEYPQAARRVHTRALRR